MKRYLFALLQSTGVLKLVAWVNRRKVTILSYHSVIDGSEPVRDDPHKQHIPLHLFQKHLDYLQNNYTVVSLSDFLAARCEQRRLPDYSVVLTFEDGFQDFRTVAARQLAERQLAATVFVITERAYGRLPPNGEDFLTWQEIQELAIAGTGIGSHTCSHPRLTELPLDAVERELADSRLAILSHVKQVGVPLSYPYGRTSESINRLTQSAGYSCAIGSNLGPNDSDADIFALSRTTIASDDDVPTFAARVSGLTWWVNSVRRVVGAEKRSRANRIFSLSPGSLAASTHDCAEDPG